MKYRCVIIGGGPAGFTAAIYASRAGLSPVVYEGPQPGGQLVQTETVENFPGYPEGVSGYDLVSDIKTQAERFGADIKDSSVTKAELTGEVKRLLIDDEEWIEADSVIICTGASAIYLDKPCVEKYKGSGVSACAVCDGFFFRGKKVLVIGGGDTACTDAVYLSTICSEVTMIVRKSEMRASKVMSDRVAEAGVKVLFNTELDDIQGDGSVESVSLINNIDGSLSSMSMDGIFMAIGRHPNTELFDGQLNTVKGYIETIGCTQKTNIDGVFAAGDVCDPFYQQAVTAAASGCRAALDAEKYLTEKGV